MNANLKRTQSSEARDGSPRAARKLAGVLAGVLCVGGVTLAVAPSPATAAEAPAIPFGSHTTTYAPGTIRPATPQATMDSATLAFYTKWKSRYLVSACGSGSAIASPDADHPYVAEAQGYGLELFALMAGADPDAQSSFDNVLRFVLAHPSSINSGLLAAEQDSSCRSVNGSDSATDGDLSVAYGLLLADRQWGSAGTFNYKALALARINAIKASEINPTTHLPLLGDWSSPGDKYYNATRPSDFMIDHFRAFKNASGDPFWDQVTAATSALVKQQQDTYAPATGLIADFVVNTNTTPQPAPANFLEGSTDGQYSYNSVRVPWHLGADGALFDDAASKAQTRKLTSWIKAKVGGDPTKVRAGYKLDGTATVSYLDPEFVATFGPAAMNEPGSQAWLDAIWNYTATQAAGAGLDSYYGSSLMLQSMIVMSGNYWTPASSTAPVPPPPTPTPTPTPTTSLSVSFKYDDKWSTGWCGTLLVKNNTSTKVSKYSMGFDLPKNVSLSSKWTGTFSRSGTRFTVLSAKGQYIDAGKTNSSTGFCVNGLSATTLTTAVPTNLSAAPR